MEDELVHLHKVLLIIMDEIDRICKENQINYSLIGGSLLGAIRHGGFIPWDDDIDVGLIREEYDRFIDACKTQLGEEFELQTNTNDPNYVYGFAKILLKTTYIVQTGQEKTKHKKGIYVDVFPYDNVPNNLFLKKWQKIKNYCLIKMLDKKFGESPKKSWKMWKKAAFSFIGIFSVFFSKKYLINRLNNNMVKYSTKRDTTFFVSNMGGYYGYEKETLPKGLFNNYMEIKFEDRKYKIIKDYEVLLKKYYGDYMKLPPVEERRTHGFYKLDFGKYKNV